MCPSVFVGTMMSHQPTEPSQTMSPSSLLSLSRGATPNWKSSSDGGTLDTLPAAQPYAHMPGSFFLGGGPLQEQKLNGAGGTKGEPSLQGTGVENLRWHAGPGESGPEQIYRKAHGRPRETAAPQGLPRRPPSASGTPAPPPGPAHPRSPRVPLGPLLMQRSTTVSRGLLFLVVIY